MESNAEAVAEAAEQGARLTALEAVHLKTANLAQLLGLLVGVHGRHRRNTTLGAISGSVIFVLHMM
jgi:hypothetical protein